MTMDTDHYKKRRDELLSKIDGGVAIIFGEQEYIRNFDAEFPFRQDSNFKYLTGLDEPGGILVLCTRHDKFKSVLFVRKKDPHMEMWTGRRLGPEKAKDLFAIDAAHTIEEFDEVIDELLPGHEKVYYDFYNSRVRQKVFQATEKLLMARRKKVVKPMQMEHIIPIVGQMRLFKDDHELLTMRSAAAITNSAHRAAMAFAAPGKEESQVQALMEYVMKKEGAGGVAYQSIVAGGENALVLHYIENNCYLNDGDLLLIDAGSEVNCYASDVTRTFPVNGKFSEAQKEMYEVVLTGQKRAIEATRPGKTLTDIHREAIAPIVDWLLEHGILNGDKEKIIEEREYKDYYVHSTSHWLGLDVHDNSPYNDRDLNELAFAPGMVFTIEPGLYFPANDQKVPEKFRGLGIRIEDDILVTDTSHENLTAGIPKEIKEIEEACRHDYRDFL